MPAAEVGVFAKTSERAVCHQRSMLEVGKFGATKYPRPLNLDLYGSNVPGTHVTALLMSETDPMDAHC